MMVQSDATLRRSLSLSSVPILHFGKSGDAMSTFSDGLENIQNFSLSFCSSGLVHFVFDLFYGLVF